MHAYNDKFVVELYEDIGRLIGGEPVEVEDRLRELAAANSEATAAYWRSHEPGLGMPDSVYKTDPPYLFPDEPPARVFRTSATTINRSGEASYSARGMELMDLSIVASAGRHMMRGLDEPAVVWVIPSERAAPNKIMSHGVEVIARRFGHPGLSGCVLTDAGIDLAILRRLLDGAVAEDRPVVIIGATWLLVDVYDGLKEQGKSWQLPAGSLLVDAGGAKLGRPVTVAELRSMAAEAFGIVKHINLFGMTELASQFYDAADVAAGPMSERPKGNEAFARAQVRDVDDLRIRTDGLGLLEVVDLCILDRPCAVLTGDWGLAHPLGTAVVGRVAQGPPRGYSPSLERIPLGDSDV